MPAAEARDLPRDGAYGDGAIRSGKARRRATGDLELVLAELADEHLGLGSRLLECGHEVGAEGIGPAQSREAETRLCRPAGVEHLELLLERGDEPASGIGFEVG